MAVSRRRFIAGSAGLGAAATAAALITPEPTQAGALAATPAAVPPVEVIALNRMGYGPRAGDSERVKQLGLAAYIEEQLSPKDSDDQLFSDHFAAARLKIKYDAGDGYGARNDAPALTMVGQTTKELWPRAKDSSKLAWAERIRPWNEVHVATWLRAVYSKWQLREVLVEFWHDHFNVNASSDKVVAVGLPDYDRIMRQNWNGNFRQMLEQTTRSLAMMYYLDNVSNQVQGGTHAGNENYARELFELHTLGSDNYLKFYKDRKSVGAITYNGETFARGYIDYDVYEAARCFTGWTIANGHWQRPTLDDGTFLYDKTWHDVNEKTVLSTDGYPNISYNQADLKDGLDVLDLVAYHIGTARSICTKLCRRLISDSPPTSVVEAAVSVWMANRRKDDQIKQVLRVILNSNEFQTTWGGKVKRPFESLVSYLRAVAAELPVDAASAKDDKGNNDPNGGGYWNGLLYNFSQTGHRRFEWATPTGHPDRASYWLTSNSMLRRWNMPNIAAQSWGGNVSIDLVGQTNLALSCTQIVDFWINRLCGYAVSDTTRQGLIAFFSQQANGGDPNQPPKPVKDEYGLAADVLRDRLNSMVQLLAMAPEFQAR